MRLAQGPDDLRLPLRRVDGLEPQFGNALLLPTLPHGRLRALTAEECPRALRVPGAPLVVADPPGPGREERVAHPIQGLGRHEDDELAIHGIDPQSAELIPSDDCGSVARPDRGGKFVNTTTTGTGPLGQPRGVAFVVLLTFITLGIYTLYWVYKTEEEMKQHTGEGIGGALGLVVWIVVSPVMAFVIPSEIGNMYKKDGREPPFTGWTGLWLFPFGIFIIPMIVWFVKVQRALNQYWESKARPPKSLPAPKAGAEAPWPTPPPRRPRARGTPTVPRRRRYQRG